MTAQRVGKCPGCGRAVRVDDVGRLWAHGTHSGERTTFAARLKPRTTDCAWSGKAAPTVQEQS